MGIQANQMADLPIGGGVQRDQDTRLGMSHGDLYLAQLITSGEQSLEHAQVHLAQATEILRRIRAAHAAGIQWQ